LTDNKHFACDKESCDREKGICQACCTRVENLGVKYGQAVILENINLHIHCGELTAIIGPNGAGKSTLLKALLGEVKHSGEMVFFSCNESIRRKPVIGYVPQQLDFDKGLPVSVVDFLTACYSNSPIWIFNKSHKKREAREKIKKNLNRVGAGMLSEKRIGDLSGGELQRVMLALALEPMPDILLLDEPVSGVDQKGMELFYNTVSSLRERFDLSIILVSHDLDMVYRYADRVILLNREIKSVGTPEQVFGSSQAKELFGDKMLGLLRGTTESDESDQSGHLSSHSDSHVLANSNTKGLGGGAS
jgi:zinc transport system ATP-binding protein